MVHLSKRMEALAALVSPGNRLCDVGCDHGYLPIALVQSHKIPSAIACDINEGPLQAAKKHIKACGLESLIETRLSDGLAEIAIGEADSILIAGMGGGLVLHILQQSMDVAREAKELILQPQSEIYEVRTFLYEQHFHIIEEDMVFEDGKYYPMMKVIYERSGEQKDEADCLEKPSENKIFPEEISKDEMLVEEISRDKLRLEERLLYGPCLLEKKHPVLQEYLKKEQGVKAKVLEQLLDAEETEAIGQRIQEVKREMEVLTDALGRWGGI